MNNGRLGIVDTHRFEAASVVLGSNLYVVGGGMPASSTLERAAIHPDGTIDAFGPVNARLVTPRRRHALAVIREYLYVIGGRSENGLLSSVERATVNADGSLGDFAEVSSLTAPREAHAALVLGGYLYVIGGAQADVVATVERATILPDGSLGAFAAVNNVALVTAREGHRAMVVNDRVVVTGGDTGRVEQAPFTRAGELSAFVTVTSLSLLNPERFEATATAIGSHVYIVGGDVVTFENTGEPESFIVAVDGTLTQRSYASLGVTKRFGHSTATIGNHIYVLGGLGSAPFGGDPPGNFNTDALELK